MNFLRQFSLLTIACIGIGATIACAPNQSPDQIREKTAQATAEVSRDAKAMAEGVKEGLKGEKTLNVNKASKDDLTKLPGVDSTRADRIIAERPYANTHQLVTRHVLSEDEYGRIKDHIIASQ